MFSRFMGSRKQQKTSKSSALARACAFEAVEARQLMSVALNNGVLSITEGSGNDRVTVQQLSGFMRVTENGFSTDWTNAEVQSFSVNLGKGNDSFNAYAVNKPMTISGGAGNDTLAGGRTNDTIFGNEDNDQLNGYEGADFISGGSGTDEVEYYQHTSGVNVTLDNVANDGLYNPSNAFQSVEFDNVLSDVENVTGSIYNDFIFGNDANNRLNGYYGNDFVDGGKGNDVLFGGYGDDTLQGGDGNDSMWGGLGADLFNGGKDTDQVRYDELDHTSGVSVTLPAVGEYTVSYYNGNSGENDRIRGNVEDVVGSYYGDYIAGNNGNNNLYGMNGNDFISGGAGNDVLNGYTGNDTLYGNSGYDNLVGEQGADIMSGGSEFDTVSYDDPWHNSMGTGVNARLSMYYDTNKSGNGNLGENDYIAEDVEGLVGTKFGDILVGNYYNNFIAGGDGADFIYGKQGNDTLDGGNGADWLYGEEGNDYLKGKDGAYSDHLDGGADYDTIERDRSTFSRFIIGRVRFDQYSNGEVIR